MIELKVTEEQFNIIKRALNVFDSNLNNRDLSEEVQELQAKLIGIEWFLGKSK